MPDTDEALAREDNFDKLFAVGSRLYRCLYQHIPVYSKEQKATEVCVHRCLVCKRVSVGAGVMHRPECPVRTLGQLVAKYRKEKWDAVHPTEVMPEAPHED